MKKSLAILALLAITITASACGGTQTDDYGFDTGEYKNVTLTATVTMTNDDAAAAGVTTCLGSGEFLIDLYFPLDGKMDTATPEIASEAYFHLADYYCTKCDAVLPANEYEPSEVTAYGDLIKVNAGWEIQNFHILTPVIKTLVLNPVITCEGGTPGVSPDPALLVQLFSPFLTKGGIIPLEIGDDEIGTAEFAYPMPMGEMLIDFTMTMTNTNVLPN